MFKKQKQIILLGFIVLGGNYLASAQEVMKLSLQEALNKAFKYNTSIMNSQIDIKIAEKKIWETTAIGLPHVDVKSAYTHLFVVPTMSFPATQLSSNYVPFDPGTGTGTTSSVTLESGESIHMNNVAGAKIELGVPNNVTTDFTVSQLIFNGAYFVGLQATKVYLNLSTESSEKAKQDVMESVVNTYHMIQITNEGTKILNQNLDNVNKTLYEITEMNKQGFVEKTDADQLEVTANGLRNSINQIVSNQDLAYRLLKIQIGMEESAKIVISDSLVSNQSLTKESLQLTSEPFSLERNIDYQLVETAHEMAKLDYKHEVTNYLPVISGYYNHTKKLNAPAFDFAPKDLVGINLSLPIFSSGQRMAAVAQKKMAVEKSENTRIFASNSIVMQAAQAQSDLKIKLEKLQIQTRNRELSDEIYQRTLEKYKQGMSTSLDLLTSQTQYLTNLNNYYQSIADVMSAKSKLERVFNINPDTTGTK